MSLGVRGSIADDQGADPGVHRLIGAWHRSNELSMRLDEAPGVGPVLATALVAAVADPSLPIGRNVSAWIGLVPKQHSSGGKNRLGNISKQGDRYLRGLFVAGALAVIRYAKNSWHHTSALAHGFAGTAAYQGCGYRARQQDRPNGLGHDRQGASDTRNPSRLRDERNRAGQLARREGWEGEQHVMQSRSIRRSGQPTCAIAFLNASCWSGPDPRRALWPAVM